MNLVKVNLSQTRTGNTAERVITNTVEDAENTAWLLNTGFIDARYIV